ncbi:beta-1,4-N-acetylgalactosaminyltransferase bre-4-like [Rhodnius prolixus]|uniref:beta-1,4-N-acetylgalactosaminyltransferase bre-4-like n=1 Tax=Rhodnius prolixus TaxID=13249 RepID=UPI003D18D473
MAYNVSWLRFLKYYCNVKVLMGLVPLVLITNAFLYILLFAKPRTVVISLDDIPNHLVSVPNFLKNVNTSNVKYCDIMYRDISGLLKVPTEGVTDAELESINQKYDVKPGGVWKPKSCVSMHKVAIIIPYRDRVSNLRDFLVYMHPFLQHQMLDYRIVIVEQDEGRAFNRAKLFNVGFKESEKLDNFHCYIFHDVDLIPQNLNNVYGCTDLPRHMSANVDKFDYKVPYDSILGGAVAILKEQFIQFNGFSNTFFGWGGEDDDFYNRVTKDGGRICRFAPDVSQYVMLSHDPQKPSADRYYFLWTGKDRYNTDGLNSLTYTVLKSEMLPLYTRILVHL